MNRTLRNLSYLTLAAMLIVFSGCKNKNPSVLKVFVRSSNNELMSNAKVIIIADTDSDPPTPPYVDTVHTNSSGFAYFELDEFFESVDGKKGKTAYFDIRAKRDGLEGDGYIKVRSNITSVETVHLEP